MTESQLIGVGIIVVLGIFAQWLAWRFHLPSILLMLLFGVLAGPVTGLLDVDAAMGDLLFTFVSVSVAVILFEGGLSLKVGELGAVRNVVVSLVSVGAVITWVLSAIGAYYLLGFDLQLSLLFGAILIVSGPTVIVPLMRQVRPIGKVGQVIKWEGIVNDPVGAVIAVLVFEMLLLSGSTNLIDQLLGNLIGTILIGSAFGVLGAVAIVVLFRNYWVPDFLQNPTVLAILIGVYISSNSFQSESGLITVTLMGIILANQRYVNIKHVVEFSENLQVLLISGLFIMLAGRLQLNDLAYININTFIFLAVLLLVVRPIAVFFSTLRSELNWRERLFLSWMAPRGIVAASVASIFALELSHHSGYEDAQRLAPLIFFVIIGTVAVYGLTALPVGRWLGISEPNPQGVIIAGAHKWSRELAIVLQELDYKVLLVDTNRSNIITARSMELPAINANIASDHLLDELELVGIGRLLALTPNDEINALATLHFQEVFERSELYQLSPRSVPDYEATSRPIQGGRLLFNRQATFQELSRLFAAGATIERIPLNDDFDYKAYQEVCAGRTVPLFLRERTGRLVLFTNDFELEPKPGDLIISLVEPDIRDNFPEASKEVLFLPPGQPLGPNIDVSGA